MKLRPAYIFAAVATIISGIAIRGIRHLLPDWINLWAGDFLYAVMMYFIVSAIINRSSKARAIAALVICCLLELSQLYQEEWINAVLATLPGKLVLGNGFLWSDIMAYTAGVAAAFYVDILWLQPKKTTA